jgi:hypothetical protein
VFTLALYRWTQFRCWLHSWSVIGCDITFFFILPEINKPVVFQYLTPYAPPCGPRIFIYALFLISVFHFMIFASASCKLYCAFSNYKEVLQTLPLFSPNSICIWIQITFPSFDKILNEMKSAYFEIKSSNALFVCCLFFRLISGGIYA